MRLNILDRRYQEFQRYFRGSNNTLEYLNEKLRTCLKLNPCWADGHFYMSILSFRSFELSKNPHFKGVIRISTDALKQLHASEKNICLSEATYDFVNKNYPQVIERLTKLDFTEFPQSDSLNVVGSEILASSYLILGDDRNAFRSLKNISESHRSSEVAEMLKFLESKK